MILLSRLRSILQWLFRRKRVEQELDADVQSFVDLSTAEKMRDGMMPDEARRIAILEIGGVEQTKEQVRSYRHGALLDEIIQDLRYAIRVFSKNPGVTAIAVLTLALGIGANTAIFSILDPLLLQKLPVQRPDDLVRLDAAGSLGDIGEWEESAYERFRDQIPGFAGVLSFVPSSFDDVAHDGQSGPARTEMISGNYFSVLGLAPFLGRLNFTEQELGNSVVLSFDYWQREFGGNAAAIGKNLVVQGAALTIVGVTPPEFFGLKVGEYTDIYVPSSPVTKSFAPGWGLVIGRLKPGISAAQAITESEPLFQQIQKESDIPAIEQRQDMDHLVFTSAARGLSSVRAQFSLPARILMGVAALVLLIACANVANLLLAQGSVRRREIAVRLAIGAPRRRLIRQLMTEGALLTIAGTTAGLIAANWTSKLIVASLSDIRTHVVLATSLNGRVLLFSVAGVIVTIILCGVLPAFSATRVDVSHDLKIGGSGLRRGTAGRLGSFLVVGQVAMSVTTLAAGGLLLHSLVNLETMDIGFDRDHVIAVDMNGDASSHTPQQVKSFYDRLLEQARALPGVRSAALSAFAPVSGRMLGVNVHVDGYELRPGEEPKAFMSPIRPGYFSTLGMTLLEGRDFNLRDSPGSPYVAVINRSLARHYFADKNPIGKQLQFVEGGRSAEIVGIVADSKYYDLREDPPDLVYLDTLQVATPPATIGNTLTVRASGNPAALETELPKLIRSLDPSVRPVRTETLRRRIDDSLHADRLIAALCGAFSLLALALTGVGLYGILAFNVSRRSGEIGVRMALGANRGNIFRLVVGKGMRLVALGLLIGLLAGLASAVLLKKILFGVDPNDPLTFAGVCVLLVAISAIACYIPARRATRVDPLVALRSE